LVVLGAALYGLSGLGSSTSGPATSSTGSELATYENPMGIQITFSYPSKWFARSVSQTVGGLSYGAAVSNLEAAVPSEDPAAPSPGPMPSDPNLSLDYVRVTILTSNQPATSQLPDTPLPLSMYDAAQVAPGPENLAELKARVSGVALVIQVSAGPNASADDLAAADAIVASIRPTETTSTTTRDEFFLAPHLAGGQGWDSVSSAPIPASQRDGTTAWASTIPISHDDLGPRAPAIPPSTIAQLPQDGIVVTVEVVPSAFKDDSVPFPYADLSFDLATATSRGPEAEEPPGDYTVLQTENADAATLVRIYFGSQHPSPELVARAQSELDTLQLPPTCTTGGPGYYAVSVSSTTASSGDVLTLTGSVPFQREDGSFDESGSGRMVAYWNADPKDWEYLFSGSPSPSPAVEGQAILELGKVPMDTCTFSIPFTVPESAQGAYPIVVLQEGGGGAALEGSVEVHITN
jgi:hypothetical protein